VAMETDWGRQLATELEHIRGGSAGARLPQLRLPREADAVFFGCRYESYPVLGELAWDVEQFDLSVRRAALATREGFSIDRFAGGGVRVPRRVGLQLRGTTSGSLDLVLDIPAWIVAALASQPVMAIANLIQLLGAREAIRVRLRSLILTPEEKRVLAASTRTPAPLAPGRRHDAPAPGGSYSDELEISVATYPGHETSARQGTIPREVKERLDATPADVEVEVGNIKVRTQGLAAEVAVQDGDRLVSISITPTT
jgi:hypothetical protein